MANKHNLNEIAKAIEAEAYNKGWNDAIKAIMTNIRRTGKRFSDQLNGISVPRSASRRPRQGSDTHKVLSRIKHQPGLTGVELVSALKEVGTPVHERTVRTALHRLRGRFIEQRDERWYVSDA